MSAGAVFKLIANDGKADRMIMATEFLSKRLNDIMCTRDKNGLDPTPTLVDIERTHLLFVNSHFKPFAALGYEYNKVRVNSGTVTFGGSAQWSIPQFGDFFNDMVVNAVLASTSATTGVVPALPAVPTGATQISVSSTVRLSYINSYPATGYYTSYRQEYVTANGTAALVGAAATNFVRYAEYPGQRLPKKVKFDVNGNPLDEYTSNAAVFHQKFRVAPNKMTGWKRLVGQEVPVDAYSDLISMENVNNLPTAHSDRGTGFDEVQLVTSRKLMQVVSGAQTPKATQPALDLWIPLLFWFNKDPRLSIASVCIPYGQRFITMELESQANMLFVAPGNLFLKVTVEEQRGSGGANNGLINSVANIGVKSYVTLTPTLADNSVIDTTQGITTMDLYINNIFVNPEIHDIYIKRIGFSLIRIHREQVQPVRNSSDAVLLNNMKWPIESMFVGMRPTYNVSPSNPNQYRDWHRMTSMVDNTVNTFSNAHVPIQPDYTAGWNAATLIVAESTYARERVVFPSQEETIDTLQVQAHGITLFETQKSAFFGSYLPYTYGGANLNTPEDPGALLLNFCLYPGTYQPSGHVNLSRAREFYVTYVSSFVDSENPAELIIVGTALNFLLISDGSAVLRYST